MSAAVDIKYTAPPTVGRFLGCDEFVRAIVGPLGSGKSSGCLMDVLKRSIEQERGPDGKRRTRWAIVRNTYRELKDTTRKTFSEWIPGGLGGWRESDFEFHIKFRDVHGEVLFRALDEPEDVRKLLSLDLTGVYFNELRQIAKPVFDGAQGRVGHFPPMKDGGPTWFGVWGDSNPWAATSWQYETFNRTLPKGFALFEQPDGMSPDAENIDNLPPDYYSRLCLGKDQEWIDEYVHAKYPASDRGSVYGHLLQALKERGGYLDFEHGRDGVFVVVDLGISDSFAIWWFRVGPNRGIDVIDHYEAHGRPLSHYFDVIDARGYTLRKIFLPHDARARSLQTGVSTQEQFNRHFGEGLIAIGPELSIADGLQASRWLLEQPTTRIHTRCAEVTGPEDIDGVDALASYRYEYDEVRQVYKKTPLHDWSSHSSDAFRGLACVARYSELVTRPIETPKAPEPQPVLGGSAYAMPPLSSIRAPGRGRL